MVDYRKEFKDLDKKIHEVLHKKRGKSISSVEYKLIDNIINYCYKDYKKFNILPFNNFNLFKGLIDVLLEEGIGNKALIKLSDILIVLVNYYKNNRLYQVEEDDEISIEIYKLFYKILFINNSTGKIEYLSDLIEQLENLYMIVNDKKLLLILAESLLEKKINGINNFDKLNNLLNYLIKTRLCFNDEYSYVTYCLKLINENVTILKDDDELGVEKYINDLLLNKYLSKENFKIDQEKLKNYEQLYDTADNINKNRKLIDIGLSGFIVNNYKGVIKLDKITEYLSDAITDDNLLYLDYCFKKARENNILFHTQFKEVFKEFLEGNDVIINQEKESGFSMVINQISNIFNVPTYTLDYNYLSKLVDIKKEELLETDFYSFVKENIERGILLVETSFSDEQENINNEVENIYSLLEKLSDIFTTNFNINLLNYSYYIVNKVDKIEEDYVYTGDIDLCQIDFKKDEKLEYNIVNNRELYEFIIVLRECVYNLTTKDIVDISNYYNSNLFTIEEIFDMTLNKKEINTTVFKLLVARYIPLNNKFLLELMSYIDKKEKKKIKTK